jgi:tryptophan halogenase
MDAVKALGAPYGLERSAKISSGALFEDRFLVSLHRSAFGADAGQGVLQVARKLGAPDAFLRAIAEAEAEADIVHLGYEGGRHATCKLYLEYASQVQRAQAQQADTPLLVHLAFKWMPAVAGRHAVTRYTWLPAHAHAELADWLHTLLAGAPRALSCILELLARASGRAEADNLFLMQVEEPGNSRHSCDLNLYQADLHVRDIADVLGALGTELAVPREDMVTFIDRCSALALGHIAGGLGRDGAEFVTVYYGVEAR